MGNHLSLEIGPYWIFRYELAIIDKSGHEKKDI